jgi:hypothetical protein
VTVPDIDDLVKADILAARLAADFDELDWTARARDDAHAGRGRRCSKAGRRGAHGWRRSSPSRMPRSRPLLYGRALIQLGETAASEAEGEERAIAPKSPLFRRARR